MITHLLRRMTLQMLGWTGFDQHNRTIKQNVKVWFKQ